MDGSEEGIRSRIDSDDVRGSRDVHPAFTVTQIWLAHGSLRTPENMALVPEVLQSSFHLRFLSRFSYLLLGGLLSSYKLPNVYWLCIIGSLTP